MRKQATLSVASVVAAALALHMAPVGARAQQAQNPQPRQQEEQRRDRAPQDRAQQGQQQQDRRTSQLSEGLKPGTAKASDVIGQNLQNRQGETLGEIKEILVDPKDSKAALVVFDATTGFFRDLFENRDHYLVIPWERISYADGKFTTNLHRQQLVQVPGFASNAWPAVDQQYVERVKRSVPAGTAGSQQGQDQPQARGGDQTSTAGQSAQAPGTGTGQTGQQAGQAQQAEQQRQAAAQGAGQSQASSAQPQGQGGQGQAAYGEDAVMVGQMIRASEFMGKDVRNRQNEELGKVENLVLDLRSGRVLYAVLAQGGVLGVGENLFAIPLQAFTAPERGGTIVLNAEKEKIAKAPGFNKDQWPSAANPYWSQQRTGG